MNYKRQLSGLNRVKWEKKSDKQKVKYLTKKFELLGYKTPQYLTKGKLTEQKLNKAINRITAGLETRVRQQERTSSKKSKVSIDTKLSQAIAKYNKRVDITLNKLKKTNNLSERQLEYIQGKDVTFDNSNITFFRDGATLSYLDKETMFFSDETSKKNFLKILNRMYKEIDYTELEKSILSSTLSDNLFTDFLEAEYNSELNNQDLTYLERKYNELTPLQKEVFIKSVINKMREKYENMSDLDHTVVSTNVFNRIVSTLDRFKEF